MQRLTGSPLPHSGVKEPSSGSPIRRIDAAAWIRNSGIPNRFKDVTLGGYITRTPEQVRVKEIVSEYMADFLNRRKQGQGITFWGSVGAGKSHLAACVLKEACIYCGAYWATEDAIFDTFKANWSDPGEEIEYLKTLQRRPLLVIDDMGVRKPSDYVIDRYEAIINARWESSLPTVITTNRTPEQLSEIYERQMSRLSSNIDVQVLGPDGRRAMAQG